MGRIKSLECMAEDVKMGDLVKVNLDKDSSVVGYRWSRTPSPEKEMYISLSGLYPCASTSLDSNFFWVVDLNKKIIFERDESTILKPKNSKPVPAQNYEILRRRYK